MRFTTTPIWYRPMAIWPSTSGCVMACRRCTDSCRQARNLEWLPGKGSVFSAQCWPDALLGPLPNIYPFIVNDPGEGAQAKRRTQAVIIDHLMPPRPVPKPTARCVTWNCSPTSITKLNCRHPRRATELQRDILALVRDNHIDRELQLENSLDDAAVCQGWTPTCATSRSRRFVTACMCSENRPRAACAWTPCRHCCG